MNHWKKMIAPIVVALVIILYYVGIAVFFMHTGTQMKYVSRADGCPARRVEEENFLTRLTIPGIPTVVKIIMVVIPLILAVVMFGVLISRIKEIQGGEEDDLSQY